MEDLIQQYLSRYPLAKKRNAVAMPYGPQQSLVREDGTVKGQGWLGPLPTANDDAMATELSIGTNIGGKEMLVPSIVPGLTKEQLNHLLSTEQVTDDIANTAIEHALRRMKSGRSVWADR